MQFFLSVIIAIIFSSAAYAVTRVDPVIGNSPVAEKPIGTKIDPVLGNNPVAVTERKQVEPVKAPAPNPPAHHPQHKHYKNVPVINNYYYSSAPYNTDSSRNSTVSHDIADHSTNQYSIIDGQTLMLTNRWNGECHGRACAVSAGYLASNPAKGLVLVMNPNLSNGPQVFYPSSESGPLRITRDDSMNNVLVLESQKGIYRTEKGDVATQGGDSFTFNIAKGEWQF